MSAPLAEELAAGVHRIAVPTPFAVGRVNCYLLSGEPLTLVDTGPNSGTSLDHLERALNEVGVRVEDLELIALTHQHMDHEGLLEILVRRSGAQVAAFAPLAPWLADYRASTRGDDAYAQAMMRRHGIPDDINTL
ncbi:MAG: MBL fold metallo-hydrolase, partial [Acidobacteriota bacterium]|nr:MBL fold metallo-hydrolase [Acidobacteriota bacterium]